MILSHYVRPCYQLLVCLVLFSCNATEKQTNSESVSSDATTTRTDASTDQVMASGIVTSPQIMMLAKHRVGNYAKWKMSYDAHDSMRLANGMHNYVIGRSTEDSNMIFVVLKADDVAKAKAFVKDPSLKQAMQKGGVTGTPTIMMVNMVWQDTATVAGIRSLSSFNVKDWATWQKAFEEGRSERLENGVADRTYGNDPENPNMVTLVVAILDSTKAVAYWKSDMLKKRREAGGVIGQPERFLFRIAQRY